MNAVRTSTSHPLEIAEITLPEGGTIGITFCPGKQQAHAMTGAWARDLEADLDRIRAWGAAGVVTLTTLEELHELGVPRLGEAVSETGVTWYHLPIPDMAAPDRQWDDRWQAVAPEMHRALYAGGRLLVHCKGGLGRAGTVAARLLIDRGMAPDAAVAAVRRARRGAIESSEQERYLQMVPPGQYADGVARAPRQAGDE
ncbi:cyclin-dependent kinase inhibitor 3 family protein [Thioalkalivibrio sp. ALE20]|uniref:cyclin-dependent kinase inhibitor 3 family protein n=1 Tax=Thioalkalivibrio sp. ALE20 TaxID=545275 RepID=UPI000365B9CF|nr:cyclin-dependent kinase inhibitor 3 family protein [Thioalkalivibrio sp. ALE20]